MTERVKVKIICQSFYNVENLSDSRISRLLNFNNFGRNKYADFV